MRTRVMPRFRYGVPWAFSPSLDHTAHARSPSTMMSLILKMRRGYFLKRILKKRRMRFLPVMQPAPGKSKVASSAMYGVSSDTSRLFMAANICSAQMRVNGWVPILLLNSFFAAGLIVWKRQGHLPPGKKTCAAPRFVPLASFADRHRGVLFLLFAPPILLRQPLLCFSGDFFHRITGSLSQLMSIYT